jgi:hypothetical protein
LGTKLAEELCPNDDLRWPEHPPPGGSGFSKHPSGTNMPPLRRGSFLWLEPKGGTIAGMILHAPNECFLMRVRKYGESRLKARSIAQRQLANRALVHLSGPRETLHAPRSLGHPTDQRRLSSH